MKNITNMDNLLDLDNIPSRPINPNFNEMINRENDDRSISLKSKISKIRNTKDWRESVNGGSFVENDMIIEEPRPYNIARNAYYPPPPSRVEDGEELRCISVVEHVRNCPLCSKYFSQDRSHLYIIILFL